MSGTLSCTVGLYKQRFSTHTLSVPRMAEMVPSGWVDGLALWASGAAVLGPHSQHSMAESPTSAEYYKLCLEHRYMEVICVMTTRRSCGKT